MSENETELPKPGQRVRWRWAEPNADPAELNGKITSVDPKNLECMVRFDDGTEEWCDWSDLVIVTGERDAQN